MSEISNAQLDAIALEQDRGAGVLSAIYNVLGRFLAYPDTHAHVAHAVWILHTWTIDRFDKTPRLAFVSPEPGSGKSRALELTGKLSRNAISTVNCSTAYLFRKIGADEGCTVLYDEIDTIFGPKAKEHEEIRGLLNAGHSRGTTVGRCVFHAKTVITEDISAFAPVALAGIGDLPDTIRSRSIIVRMRKRKADEKIEPYRDRTHGRLLDELRGRIEIWAKNFPPAIEDWPEMPDGIADRNADVWEPLIVIGDYIGGGWAKRVRAAAIAHVSASHDQVPSIGAELLKDCRTAFVDALELPTSSLVAALISMPEAPWGHLNGKELDDRALARCLKDYGIRSRVLRTGPETTLRGYRRADFKDAWARYCPLIPENSVTSVTSETEGMFVSDVSDVTAPAGMRQDIKGSAGS